MDTATLTNIVVYAIQNRRNIEIDVAGSDEKEHNMYVVAPFDIGTTDPELKENYKDNLFAFCYDHTNPVSGEVEPRVVVYPIGRIRAARLHDSEFDPNELYEMGRKFDDVDWRGRQFNLLSGRQWFVPSSGRVK
jgi:hypothetical protein